MLKVADFEHAKQSVASDENREVLVTSREQFGKLGEGFRTIYAEDHCGIRSTSPILLTAPRDNDQRCLSPWTLISCQRSEGPSEFCILATQTLMLADNLVSVFEQNIHEARDMIQMVNEKVIDDKDTAGPDDFSETVTTTDEPDLLAVSHDQ